MLGPTRCWGKPLSHCGLTVAEETKLIITLTKIFREVLFFIFNMIFPGGLEVHFGV